MPDEGFWRGVNYMCRKGSYQKNDSDEMRKEIKRKAKRVKGNVKHRSDLSRGHEILREMKHNAENDGEPCKLYSDRSPTANIA
jgi:hypothetical protein